MKGLIKYLLGAAIALPVIFSANSCKKTYATNPTDSSSTYNQYFWVRYDKDSNTTIALAQFRMEGENGVIHTLVGNESLNINSDLAPYNPSTREYSFSSNKRVNVEYILTKNAGKQIQNTIHTTDTTDIEFPPIFPTSINRNTGQTIDWDGQIIDTATERFFMVIDDKVHDPVYKEFSYADRKWYFNSGDLINLNPGEVLMRLELMKIMPLQSIDGVAGGRMEVVVRTTKKISLF